VSNDVTCPYCKGEKVMQITFMDVKASMKLKRIILDKNSTTMINCSWCLGIGTVSENTAKLIKQLGCSQE
jgi:transcription elongation factor Elf1